MVARYQPGDNLTSYPNLDYINAPSLRGLKETLDSIRLPFKIISIYFDGKNHCAWLSLTRKLIKTNKNQGELQ